MQAAQQDPNLHQIPKLIHFIWAGGRTPLPAKSADVITKWMLNNPECAVNIWVDQATAAPGISVTDLFASIMQRALRAQGIETALARIAYPKGNCARLFFFLSILL